MKLKEKIALNGLKRRLDRGAISLADAMAEYKKITGQDPDDSFASDSENPVISEDNPENSDTDEKKRVQGGLSDEFKGYSPPGVSTEPVTDQGLEIKEPLSEETKEELRKHLENTVDTVIERVKAARARETSPKRVDTQRVKKEEDSNRNADR